MSSPPWVAPFCAALDRTPRPHRVALANATPEGMPQVRSSHLRGVSDDGTVWFLADERSDKVPYIRFSPHVELLARFDAERAEVRLSGRATVHGAKDTGLWANLRQRVWVELAPEEKVRFLGGPPGRPLGPAPLATGVPEAAPRDLVLISVEVTKCDWLTLGEPDVRTVFRRLGQVWIEEPVYP